MVAFLGWQEGICDVDTRWKPIVDYSLLCCPSASGHGLIRLMSAISFFLTIVENHTFDD